jgi:hypothetical protein
VERCHSWGWHRLIRSERCCDRLNATKESGQLFSGYTSRSEYLWDFADEGEHRRLDSNLAGSAIKDEREALTKLIPDMLSSGGAYVLRSISAWGCDRDLCGAEEALGSWMCGDPNCNGLAATGHYRWNHRLFGQDYRERARPKREEFPELCRSSVNYRDRSELFGLGEVNNQRVG